MKTQAKASRLLPTTLALAASLLVASSCATTSTQFSQVQSDLPSLREGYSRVFFFRPEDANDNAQYEVLLEGAVLGTVSAGEIFYYDFKPGTTEVTVVSDHREQTIQIDAAAGKTEYYQISADEVGRHTASVGDQSRASLRYVRNFGRYFPAQLRNP